MINKIKKLKQTKGSCRFAYKDINEIVILEKKVAKVVSLKKDISDGSNNKSNPS
jgi:hypothetical protein